MVKAYLIKALRPRGSRASCAPEILNLGRTPPKTHVAHQKLNLEVRLTQWVSTILFGLRFYWMRINRTQLVGGFCLGVSEGLTHWCCSALRRAVSARLSHVTFT
ncbi:uncharacterized protein N7515_008814 [Penicillium bovifimosum]|uniref:Uncharacterized protein n=1 Tax=Penicillium bovifimosum TaxID=126998 RepID=A0A9W9KWQ9_9EURO|nr:uncharacterized protein N7515_008814 [Penicillium bovifimosum]KAJ5124989.1 hypothetical protein N7515_008814 [Penicillium bovifimosum]